MTRDSFVFYRSFYDAIKDIDQKNQAVLIMAICEYAFDGKEPKLHGVSSAMFKLIRPQIDANNKRYENGKSGGRPRQNKNQTETKQKPKQNQTETEVEPNVNVNVNVNDNVNDNVNVCMGDPTPDTHTFIPPTLDDVMTYCQERKNGLDCERFYDYYEMRGWKLSKGGVMKDWKAAVRYWERNDQKTQEERKPSQLGATKFSNFESRRGETDWNEIQKQMILKSMGRA